MTVDDRIFDPNELGREAQRVYRALRVDWPFDRLPVPFSRALASAAALAQGSDILHATTENFTVDVNETGERFRLTVITNDLVITAPVDVDHMAPPASATPWSLLTGLEVSAYEPHFDDVRLRSVVLHFGDWRVHVNERDHLLVNAVAERARRALVG